ncbi:MAG TPA: choice-of-anchor I family protein [Kiritimatiellia bacterium]
MKTTAWIGLLLLALNQASQAALIVENLGRIELNGCEISAFDPATKRAFATGSVADGGTGLARAVVQVIDLADPASPAHLQDIDLVSLGVTDLGGGVQSVAVANGILAAAVAPSNRQASGTVAFFNTASLALLASVSVGALPDMVTFTPDGSKALIANEGEPGATDPQGSVSVIDVATFTEQRASFTNFNDDVASLRAAGVRFFPAVTAGTSTVAQDFEPEYVATEDGVTAWVTIQEANAIAQLDIASATITAIIPLGLKDHSVPGNGLDPSDRDSAIAITNWPVFGMYMPDAIASFTSGGATYYATANEGDTRTEDARVSALALDPTAFTNGAFLKNNARLGRLTVSRIDGDTDGDGDYDRIQVYGARSFTIWDTAGSRVFDSGDELEVVTAAETPALFNADLGDATLVDTRSDNKGPEPEAVTSGDVGGLPCLFVGIERAGGGFLVYDVTNPSAPAFEDYARNDADVSTEGLLFVPAAGSPNGKALVLASHEISGTLAIYSIERDQDGDGLADDEDACPESIFDATVVIDGCATGIANVMATAGCTLADLIAGIAANAVNHGHFVSGVAHLA